MVCCCRIPHLKLSGLTKSISDDQVKELQDEIEKIAQGSVGRVSIVGLCISSSVQLCALFH